MSHSNGRHAASSPHPPLFRRAMLCLCGLLVLICLPCLTSCSDAPSTKESIKIAYLPITHALPVLVQQEQTDPAAPRVELVRYGSWPELMDALNTGRVDGASVLGVLALKAREQGIDLTAATLAHRGGNVVVAAPNITSAADLKGRTIAIPHRQSSHYLLVTQLLRNAGLAPTDVTLVELTPGEMPAALAQGKVDAYCVAEPFGARAVVMGTGRVLAHDDDLWPGAVCCALVFNGAFARDHAKLAQAYTQSYLHAAKAIADNPEAAREACRTVLKAEGETFDMSLRWTHFNDLTLHPDDYADLVARMQAAGLAQSLPAYADFVNPGLAGSGTEQRP